jgi:hypothetical protein
MERYLCSCGVLIKEFKHFAERVTAKVKAAAYRSAAAAKRPMEYLSSPKLSKEDYARQIAFEDEINEGLIVVFSAKEPCYSYSVRGDRTSKEIHLVIEPRMCTHFYHYFLHADFGLMHVRVQSWFPFTVEVCLNGREWLARQMDRAGLSYQKADNCFIKLKAAAAAQALLDEQLHTDWPQVLNALLDQCHPLHSEICAPLGQGYYWSAAHADVLRFLGQRRPTRCQGQVSNSIKLYDKQSLVLRVETTINDPKQFKVYRASQKDPEQVLKWLPLRFGVADLWRRAQVSQAANRRYLEALASTTGKTPLYQEALGVCRAVVLKGQRYRALNPWSDEDGALLEAINRGEFHLNGLRNRDLRKLLHSKTTNKKLRLREAAAITRRLALLRAHGILQKLSGTHRYQLTKTGQRILTALLAARHCDVDQLTKMAA